MKLKAFAVLDLKADIYNAPFFFSAVGQAVRAFSDLANDPNTTVGRHPGDFKLFRIGDYDDQTAELVSCTPEPLGMASDYAQVNGKVIGAIAPRKD